MNMVSIPQRRRWHGCLPGGLVRAVFVFAAGLAAAAAHAQPMDYGSFEALFGEPVTTSVTGSPQRASRVPASMEIISAEQIRRSGAVDIAGVVRHVTGVDALNWTNSGTDVGVRGYNTVFSSRLLVLVNGRQVYADHYGYTPWSTLPVELGEIRQIEIVKGPNSALFGFNAVGGVINIVTYSPRHDDVDFVSVRGGTQNLWEASAGSTFGLGENTAIRLTGGAGRRDDFSTPLRQVNEGTRRGDARESLRVDVHHALTQNVELELEASHTNADQTNMVPSGMMAFEEMSVRSVKGLIHADTRFGLIEAQIYRNWIDVKAFASVFDGVSFGPSPDPLAVFDNEVTFARLQSIFKAGTAHTFRASVEYRDSDLPTTSVTGGIVSYDVASASALWQWQATPALAFTLAARHDGLDLERTGFIPDGFVYTNADWNRSVNETSFNAGVVWAVGPQDTLRFVTARGAQLPSLFNLGGLLLAFPLPGVQPPVLGFVAGLPDLDPVTVTNHELAWDRQLELLDAELRVAYFRGTSRDVLANQGREVPEAGIISAPVNIGDSRTTGVEISLDAELGERWRWGVGYINQDIDDDFLAQYPTGFTMTAFEQATPEHVIKANAGWAGGPWEADTYLRYQSGFISIRADDEFIFGGPDPFAEPQVLYNVPRYLAVDARIAYRLNDMSTVSLSGQNLFAGEQRQTAGPLVEPRVIVSFTLDF